MAYELCEYCERDPDIGMPYMDSMSTTWPETSPVNSPVGAVDDDGRVALALIRS